MAEQSHGIEPDAEIIEERQAKRLLELVDLRVRGSLAFPDELDFLRQAWAELYFENSALRYQIDQLTERVSRLERRIEKQGRKQ